ncbi:MAG: T9SS type A sorting domain-containing protein [Bacteroidales bacterium]|nr:T9SS type A sorting domain-containing protein [Bacteroidales bacterium]
MTTKIRRTGILIALIGLFSVASFAQSDISGNVYYHLNPDNPIPEVQADLYDEDGALIATSYTNEEGEYTFEGIESGTYTVEFSTDLEPGGIGMEDAVQLMLHLMGLIELNEIQEMAADVTGDDAITWDDQIAIIDWFLHGEPLPAYGWAFTDLTIEVGTKGDEGGDDGGGTSVGDLNGAWAPGNKNIPDINTYATGSMYAAPNSIIEIPVLYKGNTSITGMGLSIDYPDAQIDIMDVTSPLGDVEFATDKGNLNVTWLDRTGNSVQVVDDNPIVTVKAKVSETFANSARFALAMNNNSHLVDAKGNQLKNLAFTTNEYVGEETELNLADNYPNPYSTQTAIEYSTPANGKVTLEVFNHMGQKVTTLVDEYQAAGSYKVNFNSTNLTAGQYFYKLTLNGNKQLSKTKRMTIIR